MRRYKFVDEYLRDVISEKISPQMQKELREELEGHIYDRAEFYMEIGFDEETALKKSVEQMGETESVKRNFNALYRDSTYKAVLAFSGICAWNLLAIIWGLGYMNFVDPIMYSLPSIAVMAVFLAVFVFLTAYTVRCARQKLTKQLMGIAAAFTLVSLGSFITSGIFFPIINGGKLVVRYLTAFSGDGSDMDIYVANIISVISFTVFSFIAYDKISTYRKKPHRLSLKQITVILSACSVCFLVLYGFAFSKYEWWYNTENFSETSEKEYVSFITEEQRGIYNSIEFGNEISETEKELTEQGFVKHKSCENFIKSYIFPYRTEEFLREKIAEAEGSGHAVYSYIHSANEEHEYDDIISCIIVSYNEKGEIVYKLFVPDTDNTFSGFYYLDYDDGEEVKDWYENLYEGQDCENALEFIRNTGAVTTEDKKLNGKSTESEYNIYFACYHPFNPNFIDFLFDWHDEESYCYHIEITSENGIITDHRISIEE